MKKKKNNRYSVNPKTVDLIKGIIHPSREICDMKLEGKWLCAVLDTGLTVKVKQYA